MVHVVHRIAFILLITLAAACAKRAPATPAPPAPAPEPAPVVETAPATKPDPPPVTTATKVDDAQPVTRLDDEDLSSRALDELTAMLKPVFFALDRSDLDDAGRAVVSANAELLRRHQTWMVTIEGHADERGTSEYNLALGDRRAMAVKTYLVSLGIAPARLTTVSYGEEFPFDPGHNESAWSKNRRAYFQVTAK